MARTWNTDMEDSVLELYSHVWAKVKYYQEGLVLAKFPVTGTEMNLEEVEYFKDKLAFWNNVLEKLQYN